MIIEKLKTVVGRLNPLTGKVEPPKMPKKYMLLLDYIDDSSVKEGKIFEAEIVDNRDEAFKTLFNNMEGIDLLTSHVMSQTMTMENAMCAYTFLRLYFEEYATQEQVDELEFDQNTLLEHMESFYPEKSKDELEALYNEEIEPFIIKD